MRITNRGWRKHRSREVVDGVANRAACLHNRPMSEQPIQFSSRVPPGDDRERLVCDQCGYVNYRNPRIVVGSVATHDDRILLCRRAIEPRIGYWTLPAGFLELDETAAEGACREAWEEAYARLEIRDLLAVYDIPHIGQVHLIYRAALLDENVKPGTESQEVALLTWEEIPWSHLAFPNVGRALHHHREIGGQSGFAPFSETIR